MECSKRLDPLKRLASTMTADKLVVLYKALIRSKLDYCAGALAHVSNNALKPILGVRNAALKICGGALIGTPIDSLEVDLHELPMNILWNYINTRTWSKLLMFRDEEQQVAPAFFTGRKDVSEFLKQFEQDRETLLQGSTATTTPMFSHQPFWTNAPLNVCGCGGDSRI